MKRRQIQSTLLAISLLTAPAVIAQETAGSGSQAPAVSESLSPIEAAAPAAPTPAPEAAAQGAPSIDELLCAVESKLAGTE